VNYTHIVFDIDGTLLDTEKTGMVSLQQTIREESGIEVPLPDLYPYFGIPSWEAMIKLGFSDPESAALRWEENFQALMYLTTPFDGVETTLEQLCKKGIVLGVVTSRHRSEFNSDPFLHKWSSFFTCTVCANDAPRHKPHPDPMLRFISCTGARPENVLFVGDTIYDQQCGHQAGTAFALATWGSRNGAVIPAEYYLKHPSELLT
jgi:HAD superfamily hydrolase (TIGR01549 family)